MWEKFQAVLDQYPKGERKVSRDGKAYQLIVRDIPRDLKSLFPKRTDLIFNGSVGVGNLARYPWVGIMNSHVTTSVQKGIYLVYLFRADMSGFYLVLDQGITYFKRRFQGKAIYQNVNKVVDYFHEEIERNSFSTDPIRLSNSNRKDLGYGYCATAILSRFYPTRSFDDSMLTRDVQEMVRIYDNIYDHFPIKDYEEIVTNILDYVNQRKNDKEDFRMDAVAAINEIDKVLFPNREGDALDWKIVEVQPKAKKDNQYKAFEPSPNKKIDYAKKATLDAKTGMRGEQLVLNHERERLSLLGLDEYVDKIKWMSMISDSFGYDIESYDRIDGKIQKIQIEVKTTTSKYDQEFYVSRGELEASKKYKKTYYVYRIYDLNSKEPKFYRVNGAISEHFILDPVTYLARYKG